MSFLLFSSNQFIILYTIVSGIIAVCFLILSLITKRKLLIFLFSFFILIFVFIMFFFRSPSRKITVSENYILSPSDGKVLSITKTKDNRTQVHVFLSVFDVHRFRNPVSGTVSNIEYKKGKFTMAFDKKTKDENEYNEITYLKQNNEVIKIRQIAGYIARRIFCDIKTGESVNQGDIFGLISFGSGCLIDIPENYNIKIDLKSKVKGGETIIAERNK